MAKKKKEEAPEGMLVEAAKAVGTAAGKVAAAVGVTAPKRVKVPQLKKKNKSRLPRRQKKALQKADKS
jgi:hypothetical protein